jgi:hypothetical protein
MERFLFSISPAYIIAWIKACNFAFIDIVTYPPLVFVPALDATEPHAQWPKQTCQTDENNKGSESPDKYQPGSRAFRRPRLYVSHNLWRVLHVEIGKASDGREICEHQRKCDASLKNHETLKFCIFPRLFV